MGMTIEALGDVFDVIYLSEPAWEYRILHCRGRRSGARCAILHFQDEDAVKTLLPSFCQRENRAWELYNGCFVRGGELYAVFSEEEGTPLRERLADGALSVGQRLEIGRRVLEKFLLWELPDFFVCQFLRVERIRIRAGEGEVGYGSLEICLDYAWDLSVGERSGGEEVSRQLAAFLAELFPGEIEGGRCPSLLALKDRLENHAVAGSEDGGVSALPALYRAYCGLCETLPQEAGKPEPVSRVRRLLQKLVVGFGSEKPDDEEDDRRGEYFRVGKLYIRKRLVALVLVAVTAVLLAVVFLGYPIYETFIFPKFFTKTMPVDAEERLTYSGKVRLTAAGEPGRVVFEGELEGGAVKGTGIWYDSEGKKQYEGEFSSELLYSGEGKEYDPDGGVHYKGNFSEGKYDGKGVLYTESGQITAEGKFSEGVFTEGSLTLYYEDGTVRYAGEIKDGQENGDGTLFDSVGRRVYEGGFAKGKREGEGKEFDAESGDIIYEGGFVGGQYYGSGKLYDRETRAKLYEGGFRYGQYDGYGALYNSEGSLVYEGNFFLGQYHGTGKLYDPATGVVLSEGEFRNGVCVTPEGENDRDDDGDGSSTDGGDGSSVDGGGGSPTDSGGGSADSGGATEPEEGKPDGEEEGKEELG